MQHLQTIRRLARRVRWRIKLAAALRLGLFTSAVGLAAFATGVILIKFLVIPVESLTAIGAASMGVAALGFVVGLFKRVGTIEAAAKLDHSGQLHDRLGSALEFASVDNPSELQKAAIEDAAKVVDLANPALAAPFVIPLIALAWLTMASLFGTASYLIHYKVGGDEGLALKPLPLWGGPGVTKAAKKTTLSDLDKKELEEEKKRLEEALTQHQNKRVKDHVGDLNDLMRDLLDGKLRLKEAHAKMAALEKAHKDWEKEVGEGFDEMEKRVAKAAEKLAPKNVRKTKDPKELAEMLDALRNKDWNSAASNLEKMASRIAKKEMSRRDMKKVAKKLEKLADNVQSERQKRMDKIKKERDRLKKKQERLKDRFSKKDMDRLKKKQRELEKLLRDQKLMSEAMRQLEKLQRQFGDMARLMQEAAKKLGGKNGDLPITPEQMKQAADALRRMGQSGQGARQMRMAKGQMVKMKEMMRRAQQGQQGGKQGKMQKFLTKAKGQQGDKKGQQGKDGQPMPMPGKRGEGQKGQMMGQQGKDGQQQGQQQGQQGKDGQQGKGDGPKMLSEGGSGDKDPDAFLMDESNKGKGGKLSMLGMSEQPGQPGTQGKEGGKLPGQGQEAGEGEGPGLFGDKTKRGGKTKSDFVKGQMGKGESQSRIIFSAATKGFTTEGYGDIHQNYEDVVEEDLDRQKIPAGQRSYVRRYFDLIRPR